jgi:hypothetical protein
MSQTDILKNLDVIMGDLSVEQLSGLQRFAQNLGNPNSISRQKASNIIDSLGIDLDSIRKKIGQKNAQQRQLTKKPKIPVNAPCPCNSGKKYKKCCKHANPEPEQP